MFAGNGNIGASRPGSSGGPRGESPAPPAPDMPIMPRSLATPMPVAEARGRSDGGSQGYAGAEKVKKNSQPKRSQAGSQPHQTKQGVPKQDRNVAQDYQQSGLKIGEGGLLQVAPDDASSHPSQHESYEDSAAANEIPVWRQLVCSSWEALIKLESGIKEDGDGDSSAEANTAAGLDVMQGKKPEQKKAKSWFSLGSSSAKGSKEEEDQKEAGSSKKKQNETAFDVPQTFEGMTTLNATLLGINIEFVKIVQQCFGALVAAIAKNDDSRLELEANIMSLRFHKDVKDKVNPGSFKICMLASLRSLLPKIWSTAHENAWTTFWEMIEGILATSMELPMKYEKAVGLLMSDLSGDENKDFGIKAFNRLFDIQPQSEHYFKASNARLNFLAEKALELSSEMYKDPTRIQSETMGLGLRHIMYNVDPAFFDALVTAYVEEMAVRTTDAVAIEGIQYTLTLIARIMVNTVNEGSTPLLRAIAKNSAKDTKKALADMPRGVRVGQYL